MGGIGHKIGHGRFRATLIQGALATVSVVSLREPRNNKEVWLRRLIEQKGKRRAAVALANKTVRTAWAMLHRDEVYQTPQALAA